MNMIKRNMNPQKMCIISDLFELGVAKCVVRRRKSVDMNIDQRQPEQCELNTNNLLVNCVNSSTRPMNTKTKIECIIFGPEKTTKTMPGTEKTTKRRKNCSVNNYYCWTHRKKNISSRMEASGATKKNTKKIRLHIVCTLRWIWICNLVRFPSSN